MINDFFDKSPKTETYVILWSVEDESLTLPQGK